MYTGKTADMCLWIAEIYIAEYRQAFSVSMGHAWVFPGRMTGHGPVGLLDVVQAWLSMYGSTMGNYSMY